MSPPVIFPGQKLFVTFSADGGLASPFRIPKAATREQLLRWLLLTFWKKAEYAEWKRSHFDIFTKLCTMIRLDDFKKETFFNNNKLEQMKTIELPSRSHLFGWKEWDCFLKFENGDYYRRLRKCDPVVAELQSCRVANAEESS